MENQNRKKIKLNMLSGLGYQLVLIVVGFLLPRLYLENFGSQVNGVLSTIKQIFTYLCLLEAGVGSATIQALYGLVAKNDRERINRVLSATAAYYNRIGICYSLIVLGIAWVYAFWVPTGIDSFTVFSLVLLNGLPSVFSYFVQAKYRLLLETDGRKYILTNSEAVVQLLSGFGKILVLLLTDSLVLIQLVYCLIASGQLLYTFRYARRRYPWLSFREKPDYAAISQKNAVLIHQISGMVFNNTDIILLSVLADFKVVSVYSIYNLFFTQVQSFLTSLTSGFAFALGQLFHTDRESFRRIFRAYETAYIMGTSMIFTLMAVFLLPLIQIYTGGIQDADYLNPTLLLLFVLCNMLSAAKLPVSQVVEFAGHFRDTRWHAVAEMAVNLSCTVVGILRFGICGALFGTGLALLIRSLLVIFHVNRKILGRSLFDTYSLWLINGGVFAAVLRIYPVDHFCGLSFWPLFARGVVNALWIVPVFLLASFLLRRQDFMTLLTLVRRKRSHEHS